ncbi:MAG: hypothetical protein J0H68_03020 [Sphingobacteriia bacterium]|nr:hypothetical protein [Sphingobacteriia bacterium]
MSLIKKDLELEENSSKNNNDDYYPISLNIEDLFPGLPAHESNLIDFISKELSKKYEEKQKEESLKRKDLIISLQDSYRQANEQLKQLLAQSINNLETIKTMRKELENSESNNFRIKEEELNIPLPIRNKRKYTRRQDNNNKTNREIVDITGEDEPTKYQRIK